MTVKEVLDIINEDLKVRLCYSEGIEGAAGDLSAVLCDEALSEEVEYVDFVEGMMTINLAYKND